MSQVVLTADSEGRICLPGFANAEVVIDAISPTEYRVRIAAAVAETDVHFHEEDLPLVLSRRDADNPPPPTAAAVRATARFKAKHG